MKIGIDVSQLAYPGTGVATYTQNLVENLLRLDKENEYTLFFSSLRKKPPIINSFLKRFVLPPKALEILWNQWHFFKIDNLIGQIDVLHTSDWLEPPSNAVKITTVHDLAIYRYSESFQARGGHDIVANQKRKLAWVKKETALIIADSQATKKDLVEILGIDPKRIRVVYLAADPIYKVGEKPKIKRPYLLMVGTREPRKNLERGIRAWKEAKLDLDLVIAGKYGWGEDKTGSKVQRFKGIRVLGYVPKGDLPGLYAGAEAFVYPSLYEGFGLPVLEAMSCGCPVVTSNVSSLPEVAGSAAVLVNPLKVEEIAAGIGKAVNSQADLRKKGLEQAKKFSWEKTARETLAVYKEAYENRLDRL
ncbi:MAG: glycosyltransferase family 1 protein [Candidatus Shapirobacteria bacterium]